jgi:hypothetical protein
MTLLSHGCGVQLSALDEGATLLSHGCGVQLSGYVGDDIELASQGGIGPGSVVTVALADDTAKASDRTIAAAAAVALPNMEFLPVRRPDGYGTRVR